MPYYGALKAGRALMALLGLSVLLLGSLTASAVPAAPLPAGPAMTVSGHHDHMDCDPIRFGTTSASLPSP
ncbi:hypothetical protein [Kribbella monticola]|uniref:hypothetical protein n=1 Tax=Kribbella monticola TaxID=2185285 RepID=UPI000DD4E60E|nr:hypothetical protein [Kribbella monticola]